MAATILAGGLTLDLDVTFIIVLGLFLVPLLILNFLVFKPFTKLFEERYDRLDGAVERANDMVETAEAQAKTFEERIKVATARGIDKRNELRAQTQAEVNAKVEAEKAKIATSLEGSMAELEKKRREALADVYVEAEKIAELTAAKLLGRGI